jgi:iron complex outermembrane receptor protein
MGFSRKHYCAGVSGMVLAWGLAGLGGAMAQTTDAPGASTVGEIVVTGTNIRGAAPVGSNVVSVDREAVEVSGAVTTTQLLQQTPQVFNLGVSETSRGQSGGSSNISYGSSINLRGIGPYATLTLVDGDRVVPQGGGGQGVDPSSIPTIMLQRVDIVADGASAVYGSDAIAGVANLILRRNYEGVEANVEYGEGRQYNEHQIGLIFGKHWTGGQFTVGIENGYHSNLNGSARSFYKANLTAQGGGDFRSTQCNPATLSAGGVNYAVPAAGVTQATAGTLVAGTTNKCDNLKIADLIPNQDHTSFAATFDQDVTDKLHVSADVLMSERNFTLRTAALTANLTIPNTSPDFVLPPGSAATTESAGYSFINSLPDNVQRGGARSYNIALAADYSLPHDFKLTAKYGYGGDTDRSLTNGGLNTTALNAAIAAGTFNPLLPTSNPALITNVADAVFDSATQNFFQTYGLKIDGPLFSLPGGPLRFAAGYEGQRLTTKLGLFQGIPTAPNVYTDAVRPFARSVNSAYAELLAPLVGDGNNIPGVRRLDLDVAVRYDDYSDIHANTTNPKYGLNWEVVDGLVLKASYGTSFRAPIIPQIYGNSSALFIQNYQDPTCTCSIQGAARSGGNTNLKPETASTTSFGATFKPKGIPGLTMSVNYFDIDYENQVLAELSNLSILGTESQFAGTGIIVRNPSPAFIAGLGLPVVGGTLPIPLLLYVDGRSQNLGKSISKGFDFQVNYVMPTAHYGDFGFGVNGTDFTVYKVAVTPTGPLVNELNTIFNPLRFRARADLSWRRDKVGAWLFVNYQNAYTNNIPTVHQQVASYTTVDARLAYTLPDESAFTKGVTLSANVLNLFDKDPPFVNIAESVNGGGGFDPTASNPIGRVFSISINKKW